jgi:hypothetical protein
MVLVLTPPITSGGVFCFALLRGQFSGMMKRSGQTKGEEGAILRAKPLRALLSAALAAVCFLSLASVGKQRRKIAPVSSLRLRTA